MLRSKTLKKILIKAVLVGWIFYLPSLSQSPNIVVFLSDDQGYGDLSLTGNTDLATPNIDGIAAQGANLEYFYVQPVCSPTRAEFLTGRFHPRSGVSGTSTGSEYMDLDEVTIADVFKGAGYVTGAFGKWHSGGEYPYHPRGRGFDEFYGFTEGHWGDYFSPPLDSNGKIVKGNGFIVNDLTDKAMAFIESNKDKPFFAYIPYNTPHSPMQVPDLYWNKFAGATLLRNSNDHSRAAMAMCENIDWNVGRVLQKLEQLNLTNNTIVMYFSDNGPNGPRWNADLKGIKGATHEGGVRSPFVIKWPGHITAGKNITQIAASYDLLPTLAEMAGITNGVPDSLDGISIAPLITGSPPNWPDRIIMNRWANRVAARNQQYRLDHTGALYEVAVDPGQTNNLAASLPNVVSTLSAAVTDYNNNVMQGFPARPFPVGHPQFAYYNLHSGIAKTQGGIQRSDNFPNNSFYTNWTSLNDNVYWPVEVLADGTFDVTLYYTVAASNVGAKVQLSFNGNLLEADITQAFDPPLRGMENDRSARGESYVKDWATLDMGKIDLKKGTGDLVLSALQIPGTEAFDFLQISLIRPDLIPVSKPLQKNIFKNQIHNILIKNTGNGSNKIILNTTTKKSGLATIKVHSILGKKLLGNFSRHIEEGTNQTEWSFDSNRRSISGLYLFQIEINNEIHSKIIAVN